MHASVALACNRYFKDSCLRLFPAQRHMLHSMPGGCIGSRLKDVDA